MAITYKPPPIGQFRKRMAIYLPADTATPSGETTNAPTLITMAWCSIEPMSGVEHWMNKVQQGLNVHKIRMLFQPGITPKMYGVCDGRTFNITNVNDVGELHRELDIMATEVLYE
jgi:head-tail adaptor